MCTLTILDVGHGNCAVLQDSNGVVLIDSGNGRQTLLRYLRDHEVAVIDDVLISHADLDHIGGIIELFLNPPFDIRNLHINPDATKMTEAWEALRRAVALRGNKTRWHPLTTQSSHLFDRDGVRLEVFAPATATVLAGVGGRDLDGQDITSNSMSAVVCVKSSKNVKVLFTSDMEQATLSKLIADSVDLSAQVLVFPHHGGLPATADAEEFTQQLCEVVQPQLVIFSLARNKYKNPRPEIIANVRAAAPKAHIACTQLSVHCAKESPQINPLHLSTKHASGFEQRCCCAGSLVIDMSASELVLVPDLAAHMEFVRRSAPTALCLPLLN